MRLLFDENISHRILPMLEGEFEVLEHVTFLKGVKRDIEIWEYAKTEKMVIVSFDEDFFNWQLLRGYPPKIIWLRCGNTPTRMLAQKILEKVDIIRVHNHRVAKERASRRELSPTFRA